MTAIRLAITGFRKISQQTSPAVSGSIQSHMRIHGVGEISTRRMIHGSGSTHQYGVSRMKLIAPRNQRMHQRLLSVASPDEKPFEILGLQQIAIGSLTKEPMTKLWQDIFGLTKVGSFVSEKENVDEDILTLGPNKTNASPLACIEVDLMSPLDPEKSPKVHSPALNHIGLWVDDLEAAVSWMTKHGVRFTPGGIRKGASGHNVTFIHPKGTDASPIGGAGVLIELVQAPQNVIDAFRT